MAVITQDTFDPLKAWIGVRLQQGVPIVDADWNESDDARRFELRAYLKWFVGDGVPEGNDGFRIATQGASSNNFLIRTNAAIPGGTTNIDGALRYAGRCIVDGLDVIIAADTQFTAQPLHPNNAGAAALAAAMSAGGNPAVTVIDTAPLTTNGVALIAVYLDVWERLVTPTEAPSMILPALGIESCARRKREWVVRVASGGSPPVPAAGHSHYLIATITRPTAVPVTITAAHITDRREQRLLTPPSTLITDVFGGTVADYRRGIGRPYISVRDALNSLARGAIPGTAPGVVDLAPPPALPIDFRPSLLPDGAGGLLAMWTQLDSLFGATTANAVVSRLDLANPGAGFGATVKLNQPGFLGFYPAGAVLPNGEIFIAYSKAPNMNTADLVYRRAASFAALAAAPEQTIWASASTEVLPFLVVSGNFLIVFFLLANNWRYRRLNLTTNTWLDNPPVLLPDPTSSNLAAVSDGAGNAWVTMDPSAALKTFRLHLDTGAIDSNGSFTPASSGDYQYPDIFLAGGVPWVMWQSPEGLRYSRFVSAAWTAEAFVPGTTDADNAPGGAVDDRGQLVVAFVRVLPNNVNGMFAIVADPTTTTWGTPLQLSPTSGNEGQVFVAGRQITNAPGSGLWASWLRIGATSWRALYRRFVGGL